jgi:D-3-phosphoglycerate dehydrogenase
MPHVLVAGRIHDAGIALLSNAPGVTFEVVEDVSTESYASLVPAAEAIVIRTQPLPAAVIARAAKLRIVSRHGVGYDAVDVAALSARGIPLTIVGDVNSRSVAEHTMMLILAVAKQTIQHDACTRRGPWNYRNRFDAWELADRTLLLLGFGRIGRRVAQMAAGFDMRVVAFDPYLAPDEIRRYGATPAADLRASLSEADVVSIHLPRSDGRPLLDKQMLALLKPSAVVINTARGGIVDEHALAAALAAGRIRGAGLDVFDSEPPAPDNPLLASDRVVLSPLASGLTEQSAERTAISAVGNVLNFFDGRLDAALVVNGADVALGDTVKA